MRNFLFSLKLIIMILLSLGTNCLYFHLYQNEKKCVYDEFYSELVKIFVICFICTMSR